ncbi:hypothetical protein CXB51_012329 [Gossypium anomalum]|uniref:Survival protein SurE-like phosphatase/nucleotidase domain-containing protein n=1 Tax=Gossypium anomalum TaxID=47600 RepID=A0A8J6D5T6_9ROSI|nr:hypothetical protein CXB51_012329 [Gossypium anomalum]
MLRPGFGKNLQEVLLSRKRGNKKKMTLFFKPVVLVINGEGIDSFGFVYLVQALVRLGLYNVHVCAPRSWVSLSSPKVSLISSFLLFSFLFCHTSIYMHASLCEFAVIIILFIYGSLISGTTVDCVSLALSGAVFSWSKPLLVISGINRGRSYDHNMFSSGVVAWAREALTKGEESQESDFKDAVSLCLLLINAAILDIEKGVFPKSCFSKCRNSYFSFSKQGSDSLFYGHKEHMAVQIIGNHGIGHRNFPFGNFIEQGRVLIHQWDEVSSRKLNVPYNLLLIHIRQGFKLTKQSMWRSAPGWQGVSANHHPLAAYSMSNQSSLGIQLAQLSQDASTAVSFYFLLIKRNCIIYSCTSKPAYSCPHFFILIPLNRLTAQGIMWRWSVEAAKSESNKAKKYFRMEFVDKEQEDTCKDLDFGALETGHGINLIRFLYVTQIAFVVFPPQTVDCGKQTESCLAACSCSCLMQPVILNAINSSGAVKDHTFWAPTASVHVQFTTCVQH